MVYLPAVIHGANFCSVVAWPKPTIDQTLGQIRTTVLFQCGGDNYHEIIFLIPLTSVFPSVFAVLNSGSIRVLAYLDDGSPSNR